MRVLVLIGDRPDPPITGPRVRFYHLWPAMERLGVEVKVLGMDATPGDAPPTGFNGIGCELHRPDRDPLPARLANYARYSWYQYPRSRALARRVDEVAGAWRPDVIHADELRTASYLPRLRGRPSDALHSVTFHNVESDLYERIGASPFPGPLRPIVQRWQLRSLRALEARVASLVEARFAYSEPDRRRYEGLYPGPGWLSTRNGIHASRIVPAPQPSAPKVLLVASWSYAPNASAMDWFLAEILPRLAAGTAVTVAGSGAGDELKRRLAGLGIRFVDTPRDLGPLYDEHAVALVPLLEGSGTRGKILEALAYERVVVSTTKGAEGLELGDGEGILIADGAGPFAGRVNEALASVEARAEVARRGRAAVLDRYDWSIVAAGMRDAWEGLSPR